MAELRDRRAPQEYWDLLLKRKDRTRTKLAEKNQQLFAGTDIEQWKSGSVNDYPSYAMAANFGQVSRVEDTALVASYSMGASFGVLREQTVAAVDARVRVVWFGSETGEDVEPLTRTQGVYTGVLPTVSLAVLLGVDQATRDRLWDALKVQGGGEDAVLSFLLGHDTATSGSVLFEKPFGRLRAVIEGSPEDRPALMRAYLKVWYNQSRGALLGWGDHRLVEQNITRYAGYWAFEAAAVVKLLGIDDSSFRDNEYYPADLVQAGSGTAE